MRAWKRAASLVICLIPLVASVPAMAASLSGAIFTTDSACNGVDLNIYESKYDVYLNGGPRKGSAAGLPDGQYAVQVTEPDGLLLGTSVTSAVTHPITVVNGRFAACYELASLLVRASNGTPGYDNTSNPGNEYKVWVSQDPAFPTSATKSDNFKALPEGTEVQVAPETGEIIVKKFYDANADGAWDEASEPTIEGWQVGIQGTILNVTHTTADIVDEPGDYLVWESPAFESNWMHTTVDYETFTLAAGDVHTSVFGNLCIGAGNGRTLGFWSNKNGQALVDSNDLAALRALNLRDGSGANFDPTTYTQLRNWLLNGTAVNMAYMLSVQSAAMQLNVLNGLVNPSAMIYAPGTQSANKVGFASVASVLAEANASLGANGLVLDGSPVRGVQEAIKNAIDNANNNRTFVQPTPCSFTFE